MGINQNTSGLKRDGPILAIAFKVLHADFCAGERVMGISQNTSGLGRDDRTLTIAIKGLTCGFLRRLFNNGNFW